ncbi:hypothetical protein GW764_02890 [Candidatus Parcubacteria bacterium]|nr:hypothetical protein [Candidatus Parcubacteria bacterium]
MKPLSKKMRLGSGILLGIVFVILAPILLANSFGYQWEKIEDVFTFVKTGGIYVASDISGVQIYVDDEYIKDSGLFIKNTLIQDLKPDTTHTIVAQKEGRHDWRKTLPVYESLVTEAKLLMLPTEIEKREIFPFEIEGVGTTTPSEDAIQSSEVDDDFLVDGYIPTNPLYKELVNSFSDRVVDVYSTSTKVTDDEIPTLGEEPISTSTEEIIPEYFTDLGIENPNDLENLIITSNQISWLENGDIKLIWVNDEKPPYYYCFDLNDCETEITIDWQDEILKFDFLPGRSDVFVAMIADGIYAVEADGRSDRNIQPIYLGSDLDFNKSIRDQIVVKDDLVFYEMRF